MQKFQIDLELLKSNNVTLVQFVTLINIYNNETDFGGIDYNLVLLPLQDRSFIKIVKDDKLKQLYILREKGKLFIEKFIVEQTYIDKKLTEFNNKYLKSEVPNILYNTYQSFDDFVNEYRGLFKGLKPGSQGNLQSIKEKLTKWLKSNPDKTKEDIIRATKLYIHSVDNLKYLQQADYFIYKKDANGIRSRLSDFIDEQEQPENGWTSTLR